MAVTHALVSYQERAGAGLLETLRAAAGRVASLDTRLADAGLPGGPDVLADLDRVAVLSKDALPALQKARPPLGGLVAAGAAVVRLFASPGPIYEPQLAGPDPWKWAPALEACGIGSSDVVLNCFSYHLSPAGAMFDEACRAVGAVVVPGGVGATDAQAQAIADLGVTAYIGLPSYLATLADKFETAGHRPELWRLGKALVTAEPLPDALRARLTARVPVVLMAYGTAEAGLIGFETAPGDGLTVPDGIYVQVCDPQSGEPVPPGESGEVVISTLHPDYPLIRFGTGDVSRWSMGADGGLRLAGVLGRVGAAVKVRGMFVHPHQARDVVASLQAAGVRAARFVVEQTEGRDILRLELVPDDGADTGAIAEHAARQTRELLRVRPEVSFVDALPEEAVLVDARQST